jgi:hypothetical protein
MDNAYFPRALFCDFLHRSIPRYTYIATDTIVMFQLVSLHSSHAQNSLCFMFRGGDEVDCCLQGYDSV